MTAFAAIIHTLAVVAIGFLAARVLVPHGTRFRTIECLAWAPGLGFGSLSVIWFFGAIAGLDVVRVGVITVTLILVVLLRRRAGHVAVAAPASASNVTFPLVYGWGLVFCSLCILVYGFAAWLEWRPYGLWDAISIWNVRAIQLFRIGPTPETLFPTLAIGHPGYPLLVPASIAAIFEFQGFEHLLTPQIASATYVFGVGAMVFVSVSRRQPASLALAATAVLWSTPAVVQYGFGQLADVAISYYLLGAATGWIALIDTRVHSRVSPLLAGFFVGCLPWTKIEGRILLVLLVCAVMAATTISPRLRATWRERTLPMCIGAIPGIAAAILFATLWCPISEIGIYLDSNLLDRVFDPGRWATLAKAVGRQVNPFGNRAMWGCLWCGLAGTGMLLSTKSGESWRMATRLLGLVLACGYLAYFLTLIISPYDLEWHISTALERLILQLTPLTIVWIFTSR